MKRSRQKLQLVCTGLLLLNGLNSLAQNGIAFDGSNDYVTVPNASSLLAGSTEISMTLWVYPENTFPSWPDFDGFAGFRNETSADFYILQLNASDVEARFRNSSGTNFDISYSGLNLNTWNHFALTYDGANMILYHDGVAVDTVAANGVITNTTTAFDMGRIYFATSTFYLDGKLDHVALWDKALSPLEVSAAYATTCEYDTSDANLLLAYDFSQGIINGNNTSITTVEDGTGTLNGNINGMAMTGTSSNITHGIKGASTNLMIVEECLPTYTSPTGNTYSSSGIYKDTLTNSIGCDSIITIDLTFAPLTSSISETACISYLSPAGNVYTGTGTYHDTITSVNGCDSVITINLFIFQPNTTVTQVEDTLTAAGGASSYQWIDCSTGDPVAGATGLNFTPTDNGDFAVIVTQANGCSDTSACFPVLIWATGIQESQKLTMGTVYPNPAQDAVYVQLNSNVKTAQIRLLDISGKRIEVPVQNVGNEFKIAVTDLPEGMYLIQITAFDKTETVRFVKSNN